MLFYALSAFSIATFGLSATGESTLPVTTCKRDSADYSVCLKRAIEEAWPRFIAGLPEFNFPPLDPLFYEYGEAILKSGDLRGKLLASNVTAIGLSKARFSDVRTNFLDDTFRLEIDTQLPKLFLEGAMQLDGSVSVFKVNGKGHFNLTADDARTTWSIIGRVVNDTGIVEHFHAIPSFGNTKLYFDILSEQSKEFNDLVLTFVNEYFPAIYRAMVPIAAKTWDPWLTNFPNKLFSKIPFSKIFP